MYVEVHTRDERARLTCFQVLDNEPENEITITVFRMLVLDLLVLNKVYNEALINILGGSRECAFRAQRKGLIRYRSFLRDVETRCRESHGDIPELYHTE